MAFALSGLDVYFDDLRIGDEVVSPGRTISEYDILQFAGLTGDMSPMHVNAIHAEQVGDFNGRVAHGMLVASTAIGMLSQLRRFSNTGVAALGFEWSFTGPVYIGDTIYATELIETANLTSDGRRGVIRRRISVRKGDNIEVQQGIAVTMLRCRDDETSDMS